MSGQKFKDPIIFLDNLNSKLSTLNLQKNLNNLTRLIVPSIADWCVIHLIDENGTATRLKTYYKDPKKAKLAQEIYRKYRYSKDVPLSNYFLQAINTKKTVVASKINENWYKRASRDKYHYKLLKQLNLKSHMLVPLITQTKLIGIISLARTDDSPVFSKTDEILIRQTAQKAAMAIENSSLYKKVQQQNDRLVNTISNVPGVVWEAWGKPDQKNQKINYVSEYVEKMLGFTQQEWLTTPNFWLKIVHPEDRQRAAKEAAQIFKSRVGGISQFRWVKKDGTPIWVEAHSKVILGENGKPEGMRGVTMEITERKKAEEARLRLAAIVESSDDAIISKDINGVIQSWNKGATRLYGYSEDEVLGKPISVLFPKERMDELEEIMEVVKMGEGIDHYETQRISKYGRLLDVSLSISPLKDANGKIIGASTIGRDISEGKELERRKDAFISMASHELKTPITTMKAFVQVLQKKLESSNDPQLLYFLDKADQQLNRLTDLIGNLLDLSKIQTGHLELKKEKFDLDQLVKTAVEDLQELANNHRIMIKGRSGYKIYGDKHRISQVLVNLLNNAIKYSPGAEKVIVQILPDTNKVTIAVKDFGIGISKSHQKKIFDRFFRAAGTDEKTFPGLGIGLYISSELVNRHGGNIWVESVKYKGSTFYFTLPLK